MLTMGGTSKFGAVELDWTFGGRTNVMWVSKQDEQVDENGMRRFLEETFSLQEGTLIDDSGSYIQQKNGFFESNNGLNAIVDEEIIYGATLTVDYSIHIKTKEELNNISIIDYIPEGMQVVSTDPGGVYNPLAHGTFTMACLKEQRLLTRVMPVT